MELEALKEAQDEPRFDRYGNDRTNPKPRHNPNVGAHVGAGTDRANPKPRRNPNAPLPGEMVYDAWSPLVSAVVREARAQPRRPSPGRPHPGKACHPVEDLRRPEDVAAAEAMAELRRWP